MKDLDKKKKMEIYFTSDEARKQFYQLREEGYKGRISKHDYANIIGRSVSSVNQHICKGYGIPNYMKLGNKKNSPVLFSLIDVAEFLASKKIRMA